MPKIITAKPMGTMKKIPSLSTNNKADTYDITDDVKNIQKKMTLIFHSCRFPDPAMPNKPEYFGLSDKLYIKRIMSLGKSKLFPNEVLTKVFGTTADSPIQKLKIIRSRLQNFIDQYSFSFMNGLARSIPNTKLAEFSKIVASLSDEFHDAEAEYLLNLPKLTLQSIEFWKNKKDLFDVSEQNITNAIKRATHKSKINSYSFHFEVTHFAISTPESLEIETVNDEEIAILEARQEVVAASIQDLKISVAKFQTQVVHDLRTKYQQAFSGLQESLKSGKFNQKSINSVLKMCDEFKNLNIMEDKTLEKFVEEWKSRLKTDSAKNIKTDDQMNKEFSMFLAGEIKKLEEIKDEEEDFGETITREVDPF